MIFSWKYQGIHNRRLRSVLKSFGVTGSLIKVAVYHGGGMKINGDNAWTIDYVYPGDQIQLILPAEQPNDHVSVSDAPIKIAYEDRDYLILNKPAGVATVPAHNVPVQDSLVNRVKGYYQRQGYENQVTHVATRLDKDTSGLVVFPKHRFAHAILDRQLQNHQVKKRYLAVVSGRIDTQHGYIDAPQRRDPDSFVKRMVAADGKAAVTEYWLIRAQKDCSVVRIALHTGRTHQIRVHFAWLKHPLIGDQMYGGPALMERQALHCHFISFYSPFLKRQIQVTAPVPADLKKLIDRI